MIFNTFPFSFLCLLLWAGQVMCAVPARAGLPDSDAVTAEGDHKFYLSVTQITYNQETDALQLIMRIFTDDLELGLLERYDVKCNLDTEREVEETARLLERYTAEVFALELDGRRRPLDFVGWKYELDQTFIYLELPSSGLLRASSLSVDNQLLLDVLEDQNNMIHLNLAFFRQSELIRHRKTWVFRKGYIKETLNLN